MCKFILKKIKEKLKETQTSLHLKKSGHTYLKLVNQNLSLPVDLHYQVTDGLLYFISYSFPIFLNLLQSVKWNSYNAHINLDFISV